MATRLNEWHVLLLLAVPAAVRASVPSAMDLPLLKEVTAGRRENHAISPFLVSFVMSQVWLAARGNTRPEISGVMSMSTLSRHAVLSGFSSAQRALSSRRGDVTTAIFSRVYVRRRFSIRRDFSDLLRRYYGAGLLTFATESEGARSINRAVARATRNRISSVVSRRALRTADLLLVGALYFKGLWKTKFRKEAPAPFLTPSGERRVSMMKVTAKFLYKSRRDFDAVSLPYRNEDYCLLILRPKQRSLSSLARLHGLLRSINVDRLYRELRRRKVAVKMPLFKIETKYDLKSYMKRLGIRQVFRSDSDLGGISELPLGVDSVIHKVFMEVNEKGTEAAAVVFVRSRLRRWRKPPESFYVDRPFFAILYNHRERINLFSALVVSP